MMRRLLAVIIATGFLVRCNDAAAPEPDEPGPPTDIAGTWSYREQIENIQLQITCLDDGTIAITQSGAGLTGAVTQYGICSTPTASFDNSGTASITGNVGAATVRFDMSGCRYRGDLFNTPRDSAGGTASCRVNLGAPFGSVTLTGTWQAIKGLEFFPPSVSGGIVVPAGDTLLVTGETVRITITASDDRKLHWVGYRIGAPANVSDSVVAVTTAYSDTVQFVVPAAWEGASTVTLFARDAFDRTTYVEVGHIRVLDAVRRPYQTRLLDAVAVDMAYDSSRNVMYFAEPESARVAVLSLSSFTLGAPIPVPMTPAGYGSMGIDIVPGGDTVLVALTGTPRLALLDRLAGTVDTIHIDSLDGLDNVRVTSSHKALVFGSGSSGGSVFFGVWERDLATGTDTRRTEIGIGGNINATASLVRSPDQSKALVLTIGTTSCGYVYDAGTGAFSSCSAFGFGASALATATTTGDKWLVGNKLVDGSLSLLATVPGLDAEANVGIAPDGSVAYNPTVYGYDKIALPGGAVLERVRIPFHVGRITVLPEGVGTRLFLWGEPFSSAPHRKTNRATVVTLP